MESAAAVQTERLRLSRELHDIVSHTVSVMTLQAAGARTLVGRDDDRVVDALQVIQQAGVEAMNELGRLLSVLRAEDEEASPRSRACRPDTGCAGWPNGSGWSAASWSRVRRRVVAT